jgi:hypothetical protein
MQLTDSEEDFPARRARFVYAWPFVGGSLLCLVMGPGVCPFLPEPLLANTFAALSRPQSGSMTSSTLGLMAGLLPLLAPMRIVFATVAGHAETSNYCRGDELPDSVRRFV